jgi:hypothetical protein
MTRKDLVALYGRLGFVLGVMVMALALMVEYGAEQFPSHTRVPTATAAQEPDRTGPDEAFQSIHASAAGHL